MKTALIILGIVAIGIAGVLAVASTYPDEFRVERSIVIAAPPERIHPYLNDLVKGSEWSPWEKKDPGMKKTYGGPASGPGATLTWDGNGSSGAGTMEIISSTLDKVTLRLDFTRPMASVNTVDYTLTPAKTGTTVSWAMYGPNTFIGKIMNVFINCDKMVGGEFEKGLADLKTLVERQQ